MIENTVFGAILFAVQGFFRFLIFVLLLFLGFPTNYCRRSANLHAFNNFDIRNHFHTIQCIIQSKLIIVFFVIFIKLFLVSNIQIHDVSKEMANALRNIIKEKQKPKRLRFSSYLVGNQVFINKYTTQ